jgi:hypothetical protein
MDGCSLPLGVQKEEIDCWLESSSQARSLRMIQAKIELVKGRIKNGVMISIITPRLLRR